MMAPVVVEFNYWSARNPDGIRKLFFHEVTAIELSDCVLRISFDHQMVLAIPDYWELYDDKGVMVDRAMARKLRTASSLDQIGGAKLADFQRVPASQGEFFFSNGMKLVARYASQEQAGLDDYKPFGDNIAPRPPDSIGSWGT